MKIKVLDEINEKMNLILNLLKIISAPYKDEMTKKLITTSVKKKIYELCNGFLDMGKIADKVGVSRRYVELFVNELSSGGLIKIEKKGRLGFPNKILEVI